eukprot:COSAG02_NODE_400_length_23094_cov_309.555990_8_plen_165_part_00
MLTLHVLLLIAALVAAVGAVPSQHQQPARPTALGELGTTVTTPPLQASVTYQPTWESLDSRPTPSWWAEQKFSLVSLRRIDSVLFCQGPSVVVAKCCSLRCAVHALGPVCRTIILPCHSRTKNLLRRALLGHLHQQLLWSARIYAARLREGLPVPRLRSYVYVL